MRWPLYPSRAKPLVMGIVTLLAIETIMAIVTILAIKANMAIVIVLAIETDIHLLGIEPGIKCKEFVQE